MTVAEKLWMLLMCHFIGDYVLQSDFLAQTKGKNWWHLFVHSTIYLLPFYLCFGTSDALVVVGIIHFVIDACKARFEIIGYAADQALHLLCLLLWMM